MFWELGSCWELGSFYGDVKGKGNGTFKSCHLVDYHKAQALQKDGRLSTLP